MNDSMAELWQECRTLGHLDPAYVSKQLHKIPMARVVDRLNYIVYQCRRKQVLNLGCASGPLHAEIKKVAAAAYGVDVQAGPATWLTCDLDRHPEELLAATQGLGIDLIVAGETLEHLANPGNLLEILRMLGAPLVVSVPNAFSDAGRKWLAKGWENVHGEHFCWYSWHTLKALLEKYCFQIESFAWYNGEPNIAEGLIMRAT